MWFFNLASGYLLCKNIWKIRLDTSDTVVVDSVYILSC